LKKEQTVEEEVYLGDMPIMIGGGEFIINRAERVVLSQLHRSPGVDYVVETEAGERRLHSCRIIPERGSWIEINVTKKETLGVRIDQSGKFSAMTLLRAMDPEYSTDEAIMRAFYDKQIETLAGNPPQMEKARELFREKFQDPNRYRLGRVGRFRINRKFGQNIPETEMTLRSLDYLNAIRYVLRLRANDPDATIDDIDHLGNRRL